MIDRSKRSVQKTQSKIPQILVAFFATTHFVLAVVDPNYRDSFVEISKYVISVGVGWIMPKPRLKES